MRVFPRFAHSALVIGSFDCLGLFRLAKKLTDLGNCLAIGSFDYLGLLRLASKLPNLGMLLITIVLITDLCCPDNLLDCCISQRWVGLLHCLWILYETHTKKTRLLVLSLKRGCVTEGRAVPCVVLPFTGTDLGGGCRSCEPPPPPRK